MNQQIDDSRKSVYNQDMEAALRIKRHGSYTIAEILESVAALHGEICTARKHRDGNYSIAEILQAVEALHEQN